MATIDLAKHVQTIVVSLATGAIGYMAWSLQDNTTQLAVLAEKVEKLEQRAYAFAGPSDLPVPLPYPAGPVTEYAVLPVSIPDPKRK
jgi:hypothetical protein